MKAKERIMRYGVKAFVRMLTPAVVKRRGGRKAVIKYYTEKYAGAPAVLPPPSGGVVSSRMKHYWEEVKDVSKGRGWSVTKTREVLKRERSGGDITLRVTKSGEGWQLTIVGLFRDEKTQEEAACEGFSYTHKNQDHIECLDECVRSAQRTLGGSNWRIIELLKVNWNRFYGRFEEGKYIPPKIELSDFERKWRKENLPNYEE